MDREKKHLTLQGFTFVELIVIITILAILATISFFSFQWYTQKTRDSARLVNISDITQALESYKIKTLKYPTPDNIYATGVIVGKDLFQVGQIGDNLATLLKFDRDLLDPLAKVPYVYGLTLDNKYFQVAGTTEGTVAGNIIVSTHANIQPERAKVEGNYKGILTFSSGSAKYIANVPSLIFSRTGPYNLIQANPVDDPYFIVDNGKNLPYPVNANTSLQNEGTVNILKQITWQNLSLTGVVIWDWSTNSGNLVSIIGYPKDQIGYEILGNEYVMNGEGIVTYQWFYFKQIDSWVNHTCWVTLEWWVKCWGDNDYWQLWNWVTWVSSWKPVDVIGFTSWVKQVVAGSYFSCLLTTWWWVKCWGDNGSGQVWRGNTVTPVLNPTDSVGVTNNIQEITAWSNHACALTQTWSVLCWGMWWNGQLWHGWNSSKYSPFPISYTWSAVALSQWSTSSHTCLINWSWWLVCWWDNTLGTIWNNVSWLNTSCWFTSVYQLSPVNVSWLSSWIVKVTTWVSNTYALTSSWTILSWWSNCSLWVWDWTTTNRKIPVPLTSLWSWNKDVFWGNSFWCAITSLWEIKCWGNNRYWKLWDGGVYDSGWRIQPGNIIDSKISPISLTWGLNSFTNISLWHHHSCWLENTWKVKCWGWNFYGQLWDNTNINSSVPVDVLNK